MWIALTNKSEVLANGKLNIPGLHPPKETNEIPAENLITRTVLHWKYFGRS